jgi:hypothetical protein
MGAEIDNAFVATRAALAMRTQAAHMRAEARVALGLIDGLHDVHDGRVPLDRSNAEALAVIGDLHNDMGFHQAAVHGIPWGEPQAAAFDPMDAAADKIVMNAGPAVETMLMRNGTPLTDLASAARDIRPVRALFAQALDGSTQLETAAEGEYQSAIVRETRAAGLAVPPTELVRPTFASMLLDPPRHEG